jgi:hypothetical protein
MQYMLPGSVGKTTRATFERLSQRGQEWGDWQEQEEIAHSISEFRRELPAEGYPHRSGEERNKQTEETGTPTSPALHKTPLACRRNLWYSSFRALDHHPSLAHLHQHGCTCLMSQTSQLPSANIHTPRDAQRAGSKQAL